ncbi:uncharacterized protein MEPE_01680 [Melanopsichium pennsylvanicum]|uniref:Peptidase S9 prolyl oligopeptidase catalytic domain-containing protein n=2 Tax=Melanopsichium pennsylvanicum TaxID=63383 RepID=A0AAJ4XI13_9BASI|nr:conserved hypothetical protein [Melanopsichium pennsylvanicum 4]SNX82974.1 uncharacterized protein MEPE_01680 [Melanopsichium pennsylvanicum]
MFRKRFMLGSLMALLVTFAISTQQVLQSQYSVDILPSTDALIALGTTWQVLGPFPAGMRELPFGGFPASVSSHYAQLLDPAITQNHYSNYGPINGTTTLKTLLAEVQTQDPTHVRQSLTVEYDDVDWPWIRKSAGWSSLQWQMLAVTDLDIGQNETALAITMDKTAEFALIPITDFSASATEPVIEWHTGDWYSYIDAFSKQGDTAPELPISHHLIHLDEGQYKLLVRSMYEIRIFGDPKNNNNKESPRITIGIDVAVRELTGVAQTELIEVHTDPHHSNVPHVVGGWIAGWGLSFSIRNLDPAKTHIVKGVGILETAPDAVKLALSAKLGHELRIAPGQTVIVPLMLDQGAEIDTTLSHIDFSVNLSTASDTTAATITKFVSIPLVHKPAFWKSTSSDDDHNAYIYSYLAPDHTVQLAAATPPKRSGTASVQNDTSPPLILMLHGAGVDIRDMFFSNSIKRQAESWSILPTGRTPWGYDWQLASFQAADSAVTTFHKNLYGLPSTMSASEKQMWQFDPEKLFVMGHSNGGQGAWYRLSRFPDRVIGGMVGSAYTKVSDYVSFAWKVGRHFVDPALQGILHSGVTMFENDVFASNLAGLALLVKYGSADANVPPWNSKDMAMIVDGWSKRSGLEDKVKVSEVPGKPHWWDTFFLEDDVQGAIEERCLKSRNPGYEMPISPNSITLTVFNPDEAGSKGGWRISEVDIPGRLAKLKVRYTASNIQNGDNDEGAHFKVIARNTRRFELDLALLRRSNAAAEIFSNGTSIKVSIGGNIHKANTSDTDKIYFVQTAKGEWESVIGDGLRANLRPPRPIGPLLRTITSEGPMILIVPSDGLAAEVAAWKRVAKRFAADLVLYGAINSQIFTDAEFASSELTETLEHSNIVSLGGPNINIFTRSILDRWPAQAPIHFVSPNSTAQFEIQGRSFFEAGTAMLTLAPHPTNSKGLVLVVHGIGEEGIARAGRLLPTRTATMIPEWVVTDGTAEWMGEGGVQAAGWYDREWGWSEAMSYVE